MKIKLIALVILFGGLFVSPLFVHAATYNEGPYGNCPYETSCTVSVPPEDPPEPGTPAPDTDPKNVTVEVDIDKDGNPEIAIDADGNPGNGFERFEDPDGSSSVLATTDGEHDGTTGFLIDTNNDGEPDLYWSPTEEYTSPVTVQSNESGLVWIYLNASSQVQYYYVRGGAGQGTTNGGAVVPQDKPTDRKLTGENFGGEVYDKVGEVVKKVPAPVAYSFPYILLLLIGFLIFRLIWQTKSELSRLNALLGTIEQEKQLVLEKQNFLMLASHYLRTPLTVMKGNIELMQSLKTIPDQTAQKLQSKADVMQQEANQLLSKLNDNQGLGQIAVTNTVQHAWTSSLLSPFVIGPLVIAIVLMIIANFLFADFRVTQPRLVDILVQVALGVILVQWFVSSFRKRHIKRQNRLDQQHTLDGQRQLDTARSDFIASAANSLTVQLDAFEQDLKALTASGTDVSKIRKGFDQLKEVTGKFVFATKLQALSVKANTQVFESGALVNVVLRRNQDKASAKQVSLQAQSAGGQLAQNAALIGVVLDSLIDNALKYSSEQSTVQLDQTATNTNVAFSVTDQGKGLTPEQLDALFKPFSRAESAETFNTEGLGFSLYLDKLIMHYLGGDITVQSSPGQGTRAELSLPRS